jgi:hypothetical protein
VFVQEMMRDCRLAPLTFNGEDLYDQIVALNVHYPSGMPLKLAALCVPDFISPFDRLILPPAKFTRAVLFLLMVLATSGG